MSTKQLISSGIRSLLCSIPVGGEKKISVLYLKSKFVEPDETKERYFVFSLMEEKIIKILASE